MTALAGFAMAVLLVGTSVAAQAGTKVIIGRASIVDGDTLEVHGQRIRLEGIDAPESAQLCQRQSLPWRCGQASAIALSDWVGSRPVTCKWSKRDRYGRVLARCSVAGEGLEAWLVRNGWAFAYLAYSHDFVADEALARKYSRGLWAGRFAYPWTWRKCRKLLGRVAHCADVLGLSHGDDGRGSRGFDDVAAPAPARLIPAIAPAPTETQPPRRAPRYRSCAQVRMAGAAPVKRGQPGYASHLDGDGDGIGCE